MREATFVGSGGGKQSSDEERALLARLLVDSLSAGERQRCWGQFVRRYDRLLASCACKVLRRYGARFVADDVRDLVGDVWLQLLAHDMKKLRQYDAERGCRIATFLGLVATNHTIDRLRAGTFSPPRTEELDAETLAAPEAPDELEASQQLALMRAALQRLSPKDRDFVRAVFEEERDPAAVARALGVTPGTVYSRKFKLSAKLARLAATLAA